MECIATSYAPLIVEPDSANDWTKQHVLSEQLRQAEHKQPTTTNNSLSTTSSTITNTTKRLSAAHPPPPSKRQRTQNNNLLLLHIPGPTSRVHKYVVTPTKTPTKSPQEWAALLHSATQTLQSIYANNNNNNILAAPAAPRRAPIPERPEFEGLDRVQLASRAMQMAAGFHHHAVDSSDDGEYSSASESEVEAPATPMGVDEGVMMDIDPQLFS
ncbi:hypothetical protein N0V82_008540 [Gnomoniopsis sp. IMI 355080]|nr:hypothetical protein N0V82_008540 [Gnomoniopsis sp. IMI 355080]